MLSHSDRSLLLKVTLSDNDADNFITVFVKATANEGLRMNEINHPFLNIAGLKRNLINPNLRIN